LAVHEQIQKLDVQAAPSGLMRTLGLGRSKRPGEDFFEIQMSAFPPENHFLIPRTSARAVDDTAGCGKGREREGFWGILPQGIVPVTAACNGRPLLVMAACNGRPLPVTAAC
jgi:hypothetical protein